MVLLYYSESPGLSTSAQPPAEPPAINHQHSTTGNTQPCHTQRCCPAADSLLLLDKAHLVYHASYDGNMSSIVETAGVMQVSESPSGSQSSMVELPQAYPQAAPPNPTVVIPSHAPSKPQVTLQHVMLDCLSIQPVSRLML